MCLVLLAAGSHPEYPLIVAANRDEFYDRPTAPSDFWVDAPSVLAGRDLQAGGTWLGIDRRGRFAAVTNYRQGHREAPAPRSRGQLVSDFLTSDTPAVEFIRRATAESDLYAGFNLIVGRAGDLHYFSNREQRPRPLSAGVYGLSNHLLDTDWPKVTSAKRRLGGLLSRSGASLVEGLLELLSDRAHPADELLPSTGVGLELERLLSSAFIASPQYGTRCSTVLLVGRRNDVLFVERSFGPGGTPAVERRHEFQLKL